MRFKITFNRIGRSCMLPMDYQYYLGAWIYKIIGKTDPEFAYFLHNEGYTDGNKSFKLFNYSPLLLGKTTMWKERALFEIDAKQVSLQVAFYLPDAAEKFIVGLFNEQELFVGNKFNGIDLTVAQIERLPEPHFETTMQYRTLSPIVVSIQPEGERYAKYLSPNDDGYAQLIHNNLLQKWNTIPQADKILDEHPFSWQLLNEPKSKLVTIKPDTEQQSKVRGYIYPFELTAPIEFHKLIWNTGIGEKNSVGFGFVNH